MMRQPFSRRSLLLGASALGGASLLPGAAFAKAASSPRPIPAPGRRLSRRRHAAPEEERRHRSRTGAAVRHGPDRQGQGRARRAAVRRLRARSRPAHVGIEGGLFEKFDGSKLSNARKFRPGFTDDYGVHVSAQVVGIAYNPKKVPAPKGWTDLFKDPWVSRLGLTGFQTTFGTSSLIELSKRSAAR